MCSFSLLLLFLNIYLAQVYRPVYASHNWTRMIIDNNKQDNCRHHERAISEQNRLVPS